jgi:glycosyltransferase involved in cell wall biosynthesis
MNILIMASTFPRWKDDNVPAFVLDLAKSVTEHKVYVLAPHEKGAKFYETIDSIEIYRFPYTIPGTERLAYRGGMVNAFRQSWLAKVQLVPFLMLEFIWSLYIVLRHRVSVINAHWLFPQGFIANALRILTRRPLIITTHGGDVAILNKPTFAKLLKPAIVSADAVTFVSKISKERALQDLRIADPGNMHILPMGIYLPEQHQRRQSQCKQVLFIGRLVKIKGIEFLLKAFADIKDRHKDLKLVIAGSGPLEKELKSLAVELGVDKSVDFSGFVVGDEKTKLLKESDIVVVPSIRDENGHEEGLPVAALEALAYGKPLIATRTGSLPTLINKNNGVLIPPSNHQVLANSLEALLKNSTLREKLSDAGLHTANKYSWSNISRSYSKVLTAIID